MNDKSPKEIKKEYEKTLEALMKVLERKDSRVGCLAVYAIYRDLKKSFPEIMNLCELEYVGFPKENQ